MDEIVSKTESPLTTGETRPNSPTIPWISEPCRANILGLAALAMIGFALFLPHWLGQATFVGDADRINTWLNIRKHSIDSIRAHGRVSTWNDRMFCGYPTSGLHWMLPELDVFAYLQAWLPDGSLFHVCGYISCFFLIGAGWSFFSVARNFALDAFPSTIGACLYMMGSFAINRIAQVDWAFAVLIAMPIGMSILKTIQPGRWTTSFLCLVALFVFLIVFTFLQEVVYVFLLLGLFGVFQSSRDKTWAPVLLFGSAFTVAFIIGLPRLITVYEDFQLLDRSHSFQLSNTLEFFRWFDDGIFGRFPAEAWSLGNGLNLHEGFQIYSTTFATFLFILGTIRFGNWSAMVARALFFGVITMVFWDILPKPHRPSYLWLVGISWVVVSLSLERTRLIAACIMIAFSIRVFCIASNTVHCLLGIYFILLAIGLFWKKTDVDSPAFDHRDVLFLYIVVSACMSVVLFPSARYVVYSIFFGIDFTHSRILVAALVPINLLIAQLLQGLSRQPSAVLEEAPRVAWRSLASGAIAGVLVLVILSFGFGAMDWMLSDDYRLPLIWSLELFPREAFSVMVSGGVFCLFLLGLRLARGQESLRYALAYGFGVLTAGHCFANASFQISGPHTWTFPFPFRDNNYVMAPRSAFHDPSQEQVREAQRLLETDAYRTVFIADPKDFFAFVEPHMADFWRLRVMGGYGAGVPTQLAGLPWPGRVRQLRSLSFADTGMINWQLLAILNTKYVVLLNSDLYYNVVTTNGLPAPRCDFSNLTVYTNPVDVVPRVFFTHAIRPRQRPAASEAKSPSLPNPNLFLTIDGPKSIRIEWQHPQQDSNILIERRGEKEGNFHVIANVPLAQRYLPLHLADLPPGKQFFRAFALNGNSKSEQSNEIVLDFETVSLSKPKNLHAERISAEQVQLTWAAEAGYAYVVERAAGISRVFVPIRESAVPPILFDEPESIALGFRVRVVNGQQSSPHSDTSWLPPLDVSQEDVALIHPTLPCDPRLETIVEGLDEERTFPLTGVIKASFEGDHVVIDVNKEATDRFLVLNESYHPRWRARCDGHDIALHRVNVYMRGLLVPAGATQIELEYVPFSHTKFALALSAFGVGLGALAWVFLGRTSRGFQNAQRTRPMSSCESPLV